MLVILLSIFKIQPTILFSILSSSIFEIVFSIIVDLHVLGPFSELEDNRGSCEHNHERHVHVETRFQLIQGLVLITLIQHELIWITLSKLRKSL